MGKVDDLFDGSNAHLLPDCMVPDGADGTCSAYLAIKAAFMSKSITVENLRTRLAQVEQESIAKCNDMVDRAYTGLKNERDELRTLLELKTSQFQYEAEQNAELRAEVEKLKKENSERDEFTVKRVRVLAKVLDCEPGLPDDATIIGCIGTVLGMFRARAEQLQSQLATLNAVRAEDGIAAMQRLTAAQQSAQEQYRKGMEKCIDIALAEKCGSGYSAEVYNRACDDIIAAIREAAKGEGNENRPT